MTVTVESFYIMNILMSLSRGAQEALCLFLIYSRFCIVDHETWYLDTAETCVET